MHLRIHPTYKGWSILVVTAAHIGEAEQRIRPYIARTPLLKSSEISKDVGAQVYFKLENRQVTGAFKERGAFNKLLSLTPDQMQRGIVTASTGNHGMGIARAMEATGCRGKIYIPENISLVKLERLRQYSVELVISGRDSLEAELSAKQAALENDRTWVSPYNDPDIIAGQGTIGAELTGELEDIRAVYVTIGGGGLISGIATWFATHSPETEIIGCLPENSPEMKLSIDAGHIVHLSEAKETLSDGSAGGMEDGSITFPICNELVHRYLLVSEDEIASAIRLMYRTHNERIEGAAGVAVASLLRDAYRYADQKIIGIICGGNIEESVFSNIIR